MFFRNLRQRRLEKKYAAYQKAFNETLHAANDFSDPDEKQRYLDVVKEMLKDLMATPGISLVNLGDVEKSIKGVQQEIDELRGVKPSKDILEEIERLQSLAKGAFEQNNPEEGSAYLAQSIELRYKAGIYVTHHELCILALHLQSSKRADEGWRIINQLFTEHYDCPHTLASIHRNAVEFLKNESRYNTALFHSLVSHFYETLFCYECLEDPDGSKEAHKHQIRHLSQDPEIKKAIRQAGPPEHFKIIEPYIVKLAQEHIKLLPKFDAVELNDQLEAILMDESKWQDNADIEKTIDERIAERAKKIARLSLKNQCRNIGISLNHLKLQKTEEGNWLKDGKAFKRPEEAALWHYNQAGYKGFSCECAPILTLLKASCLDYLFKIDPYNDGDDRYILRGAVNGIFYQREDKHAEIIQAIERSSKKAIKKNLKRIYQHEYNLALGLNESLNLELMLDLYDVIGGNSLAKFAQKIMLNSREYNAGWPDLTLFNRQEIKFIEIKTTDKIHASQVKIIENVLLPLGYDVSIVQLIQN